MPSSRPPLRILLIEDHQACAEGFLLLMEEYIPEATVTHCTTLQDAADAIQEDAPFDVIVLDLSLPDAKETVGVRLLVRVAPAVPIIVYTAYPQYRDACREQGVGIYLIKANIHGADLADTVRRVIQSTRPGGPDGT